MSDIKTQLEDSFKAILYSSSKELWDDCIGNGGSSTNARTVKTKGKSNKGNPKSKSNKGGTPKSKSNKGGNPNPKSKSSTSEGLTPKGFSSYTGLKKGKSVTASFNNAKGHAKKLGLDENFFDLKDNANNTIIDILDSLIKGKLIASDGPSFKKTTLNSSQKKSYKSLHSYNFGNIILNVASESVKLEYKVVLYVGKTVNDLDNIFVNFLIRKKNGDNKKLAAVPTLRLNLSSDNFKYGSMGWA